MGSVTRDLKFQPSKFGSSLLIALQISISTTVNMALTGGQAPPNDIHLIGQFIELHTVNPELDGPELYEASHGDNAVLWQYMPDGPFATLEDYKKSLYARLKGVFNVIDVINVGIHREILTDPAWRPFTVVQKGTGKKVGQVNYLNIEPNHRRVELGAIWYTPSVQRSAVNTEAMYLLLKDSFETLNYRLVK